MRVSPGTPLLVLGVLGLLLVTDCRRAVLQSGEPPAFYLQECGRGWVMLGGGFSPARAHQINDGEPLISVIEMTGYPPAPDFLERGAEMKPLESGEWLDLEVVDQYVVDIKRKWMPAEQRMTLSIPLHPDRMTLEDWQALPGIGPRLAEKIMNNRQENGDFVILEGVSRVSGVGSAKIESWRRYF